MDDEQSLLDFLATEIDSTPLICDMNHPSPNRGDQSIECAREAAYYATIHDCNSTANNGTLKGRHVTVCADFIERAKHINYPYRCSGCHQVIGHFVHLVWSITPLNRRF